MNLLPPAAILAWFLGASFVLAITPGPGVVYIVTRSLTQGRRSGLASVAGIALGNLGNAVAASLGLAALLAVSAVAFAIVKYAGAAYLIYLGANALWSRPSTQSDAPPAPVAAGRIFRDGFFVALLNPKTTIFFAAFLPQFMRVESPAVVQSLVLGAIFVGIAAVTDSIYALAASAIAPTFDRARGRPALGRYLSAVVYIALGVLTLFAEARTHR